MGSFDINLIIGLFLTGLAVYLFLSTLLTNNADKSLLLWASGDEPVKSKSPIVEWCRPLVHQFTIQHAQRIKRESYRNRIQKLLLTAGLSDELNVDEYIGLQFLLAIMVPLSLVLLNFGLELALSPMIIIGIGFLGYFYPLAYVNSQKKKRNLEILTNLPFFVDLLALSVEAGLDFMSAIQRIVDKSSHTTLGAEFQRVLKDVKLGSSRSDALKNLSERIDIQEIQSFTAVLIDADSTGASISQVLKDQSVQMRLERFVRAEKAGARASQMILVPLMIFILPAVFLMVFGPVVLSFYYGRGN